MERSLHALALVPFVASLVASVASCSGTVSQPTVLPGDLKSPFTGYASAKYRDPAKWLCLPGRSDACGGDLSATEVRSDGTRGVVHAAPATDAPVDCFYVYPTVDLRMLVAANTEDFSDVHLQKLVASAQAAQFGRVCSLYAPLYRQMTLGTYLRSLEQREEGMAVAFSDVADAFLHYMATYNRGRKIVLIGHSQGAQMITLLLQRFFDHDPAMRERLLLAMPIGGSVDVAAGQTTGGTFENLPLCTHAGEIGCVIAYRSHREWARSDSVQKVPPGRRAACVNPGSLEEPSERATVAAFFPRYEKLHGQAGITTPFVFYRDLYNARCVDGGEGRRVLEISENDEPGGLREPPIDLADWRFGTRMGTHNADLQFPQGTLVELVRSRARVASPATGGVAEVATPAAVQPLQQPREP